MKKWILALILLVTFIVGINNLYKMSELETLTLQTIVEVNDLEIEDVIDSMVVLMNGDTFIGSGSYIGDGLILTAAHCIEGNPTHVMNNSGDSFDILDINIPDPNQDIGFIIIDSNANLNSITFGEMPELMDIIYTVGTPLELCFMNNVTVGIVSKLDVDWFIWDNGIMICAPAQPGNSGGVLLNSRFEVIGITVGCNNRRFDGGDNLWLCEPVSDIIKVLEKLDRRQNEINERLYIN